MKKISKRFGRVVALRNVNLTINDGDYVVILGPSGCGKTTLLNVISGILFPTEGQVFIDDENITEESIEDRKLSFVFQNKALFYHMSVYENVGYSPYVRGLSSQQQDEITEYALKLVDLLELKDEFPQKLPGGFQQKTALARAIATEAKLMILDEPISSLDPEVRINLRYTLRNLVKDLGLTAIHVTHDQDIAMSIADKIILMKSGKVIQYATPQQMYGHPVSIFEAFFVGQGNFVEGYIRQQTDLTITIQLRKERDIIFKKQADVKYPETGNAVVVFTRPENTLISRSKFATNPIKGKIKRRVFMGVFYRYEVFSVTEDTILVDSPLSKAPYNLNETIYIKFKQNSTTIFESPKYGLLEELQLE